MTNFDDGKVDAFQVAIIFVSHKRPSKLRYASTYVIKLAIENAQMCT